MSYETIELKKALKEMLAVTISEGRTSSSDVIKELRKKHPSLIKAARAELERVALMKMLNEITRKTTKISASVGQRNLFEELEVPVMVSHRTENGTFVKNKFDSLTIKEAKKIYSQKRKSSGENKRLQILKALDELENEIGSDNLRIADAIQKLENR